LPAFTITTNGETAILQDVEKRVLQSTPGARLQYAAGVTARAEKRLKVSEILTTLKKLGKPQTAAIYKRYGTSDNVFGVLTSEIAKLQKRIKVDQALAMDLWETGNVEARVLALLIADPQKLTRTVADRLLKEGPVTFLSCYLADLLAHSPVAREIMPVWMQSPEESTRQVGYGIFGARLKDDPDSMTDAEAETVMAAIEAEIHRSPNMARHAMNDALIAIGTSKPTLRKKAIETAKRIGKVEVDWGETYCKTPDAASSIEKASKRKRYP
jgi:3-methyladenine DNA glycosylase AlkD